MDLEILSEEITACDYCVLRKNNLGESPLPPASGGNILVVTPPPSQECLHIERHFNVTDERYFDLILKASGISHESITLSSITKCYVEKTNKEAVSCKDLCATKFLLREIWTIKPKAIITIGKLATSHFLKMPINKVKMSDIVNQVFEYESIPLLPIQTMSYLVQRGKKDTNNTIQQLKNINNMKG